MPAQRLVGCVPGDSQLGIQVGDVVAAATQLVRGQRQLDKKVDRGFLTDVSPGSVIAARPLEAEVPGQQPRRPAKPEILDRLPHPVEDRTYEGVPLR